MKGIKNKIFNLLFIIHRCIDHISSLLGAHHLSGGDTSMGKLNSLIGT